MKTNRASEKIKEFRAYVFAHGHKNLNDAEFAHLTKEKEELAKMIKRRPDMAVTLRKKWSNLMREWKKSKKRQLFITMGQYAYSQKIHGKIIARQSQINAEIEKLVKDLKDREKLLEEQKKQSLEEIKAIEASVRLLELKDSMKEPVNELEQIAPKLERDALMAHGNCDETFMTQRKKKCTLFQILKQKVTDGAGILQKDANALIETLVAFVQEMMDNIKANVTKYEELKTKVSQMKMENARLVKTTKKADERAKNQKREKEQNRRNYSKQKESYAEKHHKELEELIKKLLAMRKEMLIDEGYFTSTLRNLFLSEEKNQKNQNVLNKIVTPKSTDQPYIKAFTDLGIQTYIEPLEQQMIRDGNMVKYGNDIFSNKQYEDAIDKLKEYVIERNQVLRDTPIEELGKLLEEQSKTVYDNTDQCLYSKYKTIIFTRKNELLSIHNPAKTAQEKAKDI
uniref:Uncharacterized protein n=1 Tax=Ditylenchus dipsaci TaxID=166011 RepID=A0A915CNL7_9BILA